MKMEFDNIKSSAALIYDEFIQNAGESTLKAFEITHYIHHLAFSVSKPCASH